MKHVVDLIWEGSEWLASCSGVSLTAPDVKTALRRMRSRVKLPRGKKLTPRVRMPWHAGRRIKGLCSVEREARARRVSVEAELVTYGVSAKDIAFLTR